MSDQKTNFADALSLLKKNAEQRSYDVWVPSLNQEVKFKPLTTLHHKKFVKSLIDSSLFTTSLNLHIYDVIKQSCLDNSIDVDTLTVFDKSAICFALRKHNFKKPYSVLLSETENRDISLDDLLVGFKKKYKDIEQGEISKGSLTIKLSLPTLKREREFDAYIFSKHLANLNKTDENQVNQVLADLVLYGSIVYIDSLTIGDQVVDFSTLRVDQKVELIGNLDALIFNSLNEYIQKCTEARSNLCSIEINGLDDKPLNVEISVDAGFFIDE
jgi:hypothetical protein